MKTLKDYKKLNYRMELEFDSEDAVHIVRFPDLPGCIAHGENPQKALKEAIAVKNEWLKVALESGWDISEPAIPSQVSGRLTFRPPKYLHEKIIDRAKIENTSINQLLISLIAEALERKKSNDIEETVSQQTDEIKRMGSLLRLSICSQATFTNPAWEGLGNVSSSQRYHTGRTLPAGKKSFFEDIEAPVTQEGR